MADFKLDKATFDESYAVLQNAANKQVIEHIENLAQVLVPLKGENETIDKVIANCQKTQEFYNEQFLPVVKSVLNDFEQMADIAEYIRSANAVDDVAVGSIDYQKSGIDASEVM